MKHVALLYHVLPIGKSPILIIGKFGKPTYNLHRIGTRPHYQSLRDTLCDPNAIL